MILNRLSQQIRNWKPAKKDGKPSEETEQKPDLLIDCLDVENIKKNAIKAVAKPNHITICFISDQTVTPKAIQRLIPDIPNVRFIHTQNGKTNALDLELLSYASYLAGRYYRKNIEIRIWAFDKDYDPAIKRLQEKGLKIFRCEPSVSCVQRNITNNNLEELKLDITKQVLRHGKKKSFATNLTNGIANRINYPIEEIFAYINKQTSSDTRLASLICDITDAYINTGASKSVK